MNVEAKLREERQRAILEKLGDGRVLAAELARDFATSEDTVRRDLRALAAAGLCRRVYGGALPLSPSSAPIATRLRVAPERKAALATCAARLLSPGQVVFLDAGSTGVAIAEALPTMEGLVVVTHAPAIAATLATRGDITLQVLGGRLDARTGACLGVETLAALEQIRPDTAFLGACALDAGAGLAVFDAEDAAFKRVLMRAGRRIVAVVTTEKLATTAPFLVGPAASLHDVVLEAGSPETARAHLARAGIRVHIAGSVA